MHRHVILGERRVHDAPGALVERNFLHEREAEPHDDAAAELTRRRLGVEDAPAIERAEEAADAQLASDDVHSDLAKQGAVAMHGPMLQLERHRRLGLDGHLLATGAAEDRNVAFPTGFLVEST